MAGDGVLDGNAAGAGAYWGRELPSRVQPMSDTADTKSRRTVHHSSNLIESPETKTKREAWLLENKAAFDSWNAYHEEHGLILDAYRQF